ncbi:N-glycosylase/DNA lyase-like [Watersipora subatra]|uniref:N-glycosylase/DNA lyase-like n=1 Tax=Watersipora subatra TaxID=2589382 RepID=UPI00355AEDA5
MRQHLWRRIPMIKSDIDLRTLLTCGQSFSWKETEPNIWSNVIDNVVFSLSQDPSALLWCTPIRDGLYGYSFTASGDTDTTNGKNCETLKIKRKADAPLVESPMHKAIKTEVLTDHFLNARADGSSDKVTDEKAENILQDYFQLKVDLAALYQKWAKVDSHFEGIAESFLGIRIMRQDPTENLFSFICSSNNHVSRISSMVHKLKENFGTKRGSLGADCMVYSFPTAKSLDEAEVESKLRELGFGYRAKYIAATARIINRERPSGWLKSLRTRSYEDCISELTKLQGVGRKVADCVALMSLDKHHVVPVDTHVLQIAFRDYRIPGVGKDMKSLTPAIHNKIGSFFVDLYGDYAGWAHTVLFAADLKRFSDHKPTKSGLPAVEDTKPLAKTSVSPAKTTKPAIKDSKLTTEVTKPTTKVSKPAAKGKKPTTKVSKPAAKRKKPATKK